MAERVEPVEPYEHAASRTSSRAGGVIDAAAAAAGLELEKAANGIRFACFGETRLEPAELARVIEAVPATVAPALGGRVFYFVPLAMAAAEPAGSKDRVQVAAVYTPELADSAICHRTAQVAARGDLAQHEGVFISARLLRDQFALAFEFFINVAHGFVEVAGVPAAFDTLAWTQAVADVRGETSQDAAEARAEATAGDKSNQQARLDFMESAFADALAIYMLSLAVDFDYAELREREYPLLAPNALADRLRLMATLFPPNDGYEFSIRYRRR